MAKEPNTVSEHIIALYGHIKGLKREIFSIKQNHLKHMHTMTSTDYMVKWTGFYTGYLVGLGLLFLALLTTSL